MNGTPSISVAMIVLNEAPRLRELLPQLAWADEVVVVDGGSSDETIAVAELHGCVVTSRKFDNFAAQRNHALAACKGEWVLSLDADECPTPAIVEELRGKISDPHFDAYRVRIRSNIFGYRMRFSGTQNDTPIRLFRRGSAVWSGHVHEQLIVPGTVGRLEHVVEHHTLPDLPAFLAKVNRYTRLQAQRYVSAGLKPKLASKWREPPREIFRRLVWKHGWLDGPYGWAFCLLSGLSAWVQADRHHKLWNLRKQSSYATKHRAPVNAPHFPLTAKHPEKLSSYGGEQ